MRKSNRKQTDQGPPHVAFRVDEATRLALDERAALLEVKPNKLARSLMKDGLDFQTFVPELKDMLTQIYQLLLVMRHDHNLAVVALLASAGKVEGAEANQWVQDNLNDKP